MCPLSAPVRVPVSCSSPAGVEYIKRAGRGLTSGGGEIDRSAMPKASFHAFHRIVRRSADWLKYQLYRHSILAVHCGILIAPSYSIAPKSRILFFATSCSGTDYHTTTPTNHQSYNTTSDSENPDDAFRRAVPCRQPLCVGPQAAAANGVPVDSSLSSGGWRHGCCRRRPQQQQQEEGPEHERGYPGVSGGDCGRALVLLFRSCVQGWVEVGRSTGGGLALRSRAGFDVGGGRTWIFPDRGETNSSSDGTDSTIFYYAVLTQLIVRLFHV